jgi:hypothetical protein
MSFKILVTTTNANLPYLKRCVESIKTATEDEITVIDFSKTNILYHQWRDPLFKNVNYVFRSLSGLGSNQNFFLKSLIGTTYHFAYFNDDVIIHPEFLKNAEERLKDEVGFIGGVPNKGPWCQTLDYAIVPEPTDQEEEIRDLRLLNWEGSAFVLSSDALTVLYGYDGYWFDERFDPTGYIADADFIARIQLMGYQAIRSWNLPFWHAKGITQILYRVPGTKDMVRERALGILRNKWNGLDLESEEVITYADFECKECRL